jgi:hypothetical protein
MSLTTYSGLKTEIQDWAIRADMSATVDTLIDLFEAWANRNLRTRSMEAEATSTATEYMEFPSDYLELRDIQWQGSPRVQLTYVTPQQADEIDPYATTGTPYYFTMIGNQIRLVPSPSSGTDIRIAYWQKITALSDANTSNWLLAAHPDAYLYGSLFHGLAWAHNPQVAAFIRDGWTSVVGEIRAMDRKSNIGGPLVARSVYL